MILPVHDPGAVPKPGNYGVSHGSGMVGELIRHATESASVLGQ